ncbi:MAG: methionine adenosyltransferase [Planctomycetes bacterium]|nr:methionine adenosyltransferase [Planctomycetota bacterium]
MRTGRRLFSSEAVCMGHPDKVADQCSDAILDELLRQDENSRVACEVMVKNGLAIVAGEITTEGYVEIPVVIKQTIKEIGYIDPTNPFNCVSVGVLSCIEPQSPDIAVGVDANKSKKKDLGAGDQGMMFGYACRETDELMPMPITMARRIVNRAAEVRQKSILKFLRPDGKAQVTVEYEDDRPLRVHTVVCSLQHAPEINIENLREAVREEVIRKSIPENLLDKKTIYHINPTGRFVVGGPQADCGLTGRKIIVDTYGGMGTHGGGSFSGKDATKVDRSASYAARHAAKQVVAAGLADRIEVQLAYAIGVSQPVSIAVNTFGTGKVSERVIVELLQKHFDFAPSAMIRNFSLRKPVFLETARYGHFGREHYTWEKRDKAEALRKEAGV